MKKIMLLALFVYFSGIGFQVYGQKVISGKSPAKKVTIKPIYQRGLPPNLFVNLSFEDDNKNGILEANEKARLSLTISNKGKGPAQGLKITVKDKT